MRSLAQNKRNLHKMVELSQPYSCPSYRRDAKTTLSLPQKYLAELNFSPGSR